MPTKLDSGSCAASGGRELVSIRLTTDNERHNAIAHAGHLGHGKSLGT
jgi:hypothetical protein